MSMRSFGLLMLVLVVGPASSGRADEAPLPRDASAAWLTLLRSDSAEVRAAAATILTDLVRKHPPTAPHLVRTLASDNHLERVNESVRWLVPLAKESPATVSALILQIRERESSYVSRNFCVKVLSQVGRAAATPEFVEALSEKYCPVPGAYLRVLRALGKDAIPVLKAGFHHPNENVRKWATIALRVMGRTDPEIQTLLQQLQSEPPPLRKLSEGPRPE